MLRNPTRSGRPLPVKYHPRNTLARGVAAPLLLLAAPGAALAQSGVLDPTFGTAGVTTTAIGVADDFGRALAVQADDRIVVAGTCNMGNDDFCVVRYDLDGSLDTTFGGSGKVTTAIRTGIDQAAAVTIDGNQKIVVAGFSRESSKDAFALARYLPNGTLDATFDGDGKLTTAIGTLEDHARAIAVQGDGKIVVAGYMRTGANRDLALARYLADGTLDTTFSGDGKVALGVGTGDDEAAAVAIQPADGKIVIAGYAADGGLHDLLIARFLTNGSLDPSFGGGTGTVRITFGAGDAFGNGVALQSDGKIIAAGYARVGTVLHFAVARVDANGVLDSLLDGDGKLTTTIGSTSQASSVAVDDTGRFVVAGFARIAGNDDMALVRYDGAGQLDTNFAGGIVTLPVGNGPDGANGVAVQSDGKILIAGSAREGNNDDFAIARYLLDDCGNGIVDVGEACDGGAVIDGDCCTSACTLLPASSLCRASTDACDVADFCDGSSAACPDARLPDGDSDGVCDLIDLCPVDVDPLQEDGDDDGLGDVCDPCTNGVTVGKAKIKLTNFVTAPGDDSFSFSGLLDFATAPALDPVAVGARVILEDASGVRFDVAVPNGAYSALTRTGWIVNGGQTSFTFRSATSVGGMLDKLKLSKTSARPDLIKFTMSGKKSAVAATAVVPPLSAKIVLDAPTAATGECGEIAFPGPAPTPACALNRTGTTLNCK